ncbi:S9 family peptidase [Halorarum salinum]|uniref:S9 family peptidase n=1 Tax=Halorarum salinum TaxID=2743089 RepID=A0A7D5QCS0_9EURY|nr:LpqB family beta-propeller domain-containing protein [Halobaculum salinum]QLG63279.1 S9 family peptidase [Halobaculum salinum]
MDADFSVEDALSLRTVSAPAWNDDASRAGYLRFGDGETTFAHGAPGGDPTAVPGPVGGFDWRPGHPDGVALAADGDVTLRDVSTGESRTLASADADHAGVTWAGPDRLLYVRDCSVWGHDLADGGVAELLTDVRSTPFGVAPLAVSPDDELVATVRDADDGPGELVVYDVDLGEHVRGWRPPNDRVVAGYDWVGPDHLVYALDDTDASARRFRSVRVGVDDGPGVTLLSETSDVVCVEPTPVGADDGWFACLSDRDGHAHLYLVDAGARRAAVASDADGEAAPGFDGEGVVRVTEGAFEARGDATDLPAWSPDGERVAFVTNEADAGERRLHVADREGTVERVVDESANVHSVDWGANDRLLCVRAGRTEPADVCALESGAEGRSDADDPYVRVSDAYPDRERLSAFPEPEPVSFDGTGGETVRGYLYLPDGEDGAWAGDDRPAVVWCHGGPVRQMRRGFHHMRSYAFFHLFNHVLVSRGYAVLELNYRGGIGYGHEFEQGVAGAIGVDDVDDCVRAAEFLRGRPEVGDRVGLWGLSYGGFLANAVATKTDAYDAAVNFAGIWDWREWVRYAESFGWGAARRFRAQFGGGPDDPGTAEAYEVASPCEFAGDLDAPLFALHGTDDPNVHFEQMDLLVDELVDRGAEFETAYYPGEDHMFREPATWRDAMGRVLPFLDGHLRE